MPRYLYAMPAAVELRSGSATRPGRASRRPSARPRPDARTAALGLLARRDLSEAEVRERLGQREYAEPEVEEAVGRLRDRGYLDDGALAKALAASRAAGRLHGPNRVADYLRRRRLPPDLVRSAVEEAFPGGAETELAKQAAARLASSRAKAPAIPGEPGEEDGYGRRQEERKRRERLLRRLVGRGFTWEAALAAVSAADLCEAEPDDEAQPDGGPEPSAFEETSP